MWRFDGGISVTMKSDIVKIKYFRKSENVMVDLHVSYSEKETLHQTSLIKELFIVTKERSLPSLKLWCKSFFLKF